MRDITIFSPATVSNVVCGFDCLGFSIAEPFDKLTIRKTDEQGIRIINNDDFGLPADPQMNVAGVAVLEMLRVAGIDQGLEITSTKSIKPGSGIGSSAASSCGAVVGVNELLGLGFSKRELVEFAMRGEMLASGARHADNAAPCIYGGFVLVRSAEPLDVVELSCPPLWVTVIHPQIEIKTAEARAILPVDVPLRSAVRQWSNLGAFVAALSSGDLDLLSRSMEDVIVEPVRKGLIPHFDEVMKAGRTAGAIGGGISGSGPSMFLLAENENTAVAIGQAIRNEYAVTGIDFNTYVSEIKRGGVSIS
ncbi:MAG: homoserine kinase [Acidobacteria bacterium]|nr:homoserine kinase [Acidobacteriota bacterium]